MRRVPRNSLDGKSLMGTMVEVEVLRAACCIAGIDGDVTAAELVVLKKIAEQVGVGQVSLNAMINRAQRDPNFFEEQFRILKAEPNRAMNSLLAAALADGEIGENEMRLLKVFAERLKVDAATLDRLVAEARQFIAARRNDR